VFVGNPRGKEDCRRNVGLNSRLSGSRQQGISGRESEKAKRREEFLTSITKMGLGSTGWKGEIDKKLEKREGLVRTKDLAVVGIVGEGNSTWVFG